MSEKEPILYEGIRIRLWQIGEAGGYSVEKVEMFSSKVKLTLSGGEPFECAYNEAERLAVVVDAELVLNEKIIRKSRTGEYK